MVVKFFATIRSYTNTMQTTVDRCETVEVLLRHLCDVYGSKFEKKIFVNGELSSEIIILVNGRHITHCDGIKTKLVQDDEVSIFPVVAGG